MEVKKQQQEEEKEKKSTASKGAEGEDKHQLTIKTSAINQGLHTWHCWDLK